MSVIAFRNVDKSFRGHVLYRDVSFDIQEGATTSVEGPNGSGKSVLFRLMCGFSLPDSGTITIDQRFLSKGRTFPEHFGVVIDRPGFLAHQTGLQNLEGLAKIRRRITVSEISETMASLGLDPNAPQPVRKYSLGMRQKLALAQALMENPKVLILDEPFNALDKESVLQVKNLLRKFVSRGNTLIFSSHNLVDIDDLAQIRLRIENGGILNSTTF